MHYNDIQILSASILGSFSLNKAEQQVQTFKPRDNAVILNTSYLFILLQKYAKISNTLGYELSEHAKIFEFANLGVCVEIF